jgi:hypothetical protein
MTTTAAQDEFNELMRDKGRETRHPEDRLDDSDLSDPESPGAADDYLEKVDTDDELDLPRDMRSNNSYMPSLRSEANTGPKGVIADAQAFEQAKKQARRFTWKKTQSPPAQYNVTANWHEKDASSEDDGDDSFMKEWRAARLRELQNVGQRIRSRTNSPSRRVYGNFPLVDAEGYLDALDKSSPETTVVVFVYSNEVRSPHDNARVPATNYLQAGVTAEIEACMAEVAKRNDTVRFIKLHNDDAEMEEAGLPAVLSYKRGEKIAGLVPLLDALPDDSELSAISLETALRR